MKKPADSVANATAFSADCVVSNPAMQRLLSLELSASETRVAHFVVTNQSTALTLSIAQLAEQAQVSEPTVARFCQSAGFSGYKDFRLWLARTVGAGTMYIHANVSAADTPANILTKVWERSQASLAQTRLQIDDVQFSQAVGLLVAAHRIEFYGQGNSGITAQDGAHKFFRMGIPTAAHSDPHIHSVSAAMLDMRDVVVALSNSGRSSEILDTVEIAKRSGAKVIALTPPASPLALIADCLLAVNPSNEPDLYAPMTTRLSQLVLIDALAVATALQIGPRLAAKLVRNKTVLQTKRVPTKGSS